MIEEVEHGKRIALVEIWGGLQGGDHLCDKKAKSYLRDS